MKFGIETEEPVEESQLEFTDHGETEPRQFNDVAAAIGTKNLLIAIVTMPFVFLVVVMGILAVFGSDAAEERVAANPDTQNQRVVSVRASGGENTKNAPASVVIEEPNLATVTVPTRASASQARFPVSLDSLGASVAAGGISLDGDRLAVRIDGPDGGSIVIYDLASETVVRTVPLSALAAVESSDE